MRLRIQFIVIKEIYKHGWGVLFTILDISIYFGSNDLCVLNILGDDWSIRYTKGETKKNSEKQNGVVVDFFPIKRYLYYL